MRNMKDISALILAGGKSSRMGRDKAALPWDDTTLLWHQFSRLQTLGIEDVIISGAGHLPDIYPEKGPLSGIHAGLTAAKHASVLVISADTPLVPDSLLEDLAEAHFSRKDDITVVSHKGGIEPLIGVYERSVIPAAEAILITDNTSVRELFAKAAFSAYEYIGDPRLLRGCNTPAEYEALIALKSII